MSDEMTIADLDRAAGVDAQQVDPLTPPWNNARAANLIQVGLIFDLKDGTKVRVKGRPPIRAVRITYGEAPDSPSSITLADAKDYCAAYPIFRAPGASKYGPLAFTNEQDAIDLAEKVSKYLEGAD